MKFFSPFIGVYRGHHAPCWPSLTHRNTAPRSISLALQQPSAFSGSCGPGRASCPSRMAVDERRFALHRRQLHEFMFGPFCLMTKQKGET